MEDLAETGKGEALADEWAEAEPSDALILRPGGTAVDGAMVAPYEVVWVQSFETGQSRTLRRTIVDRVEREATEDGTELVRTQTFLGLDGKPTSRRVNRVDGRTLLPVSERWSFRGRVTHVDYRGARVSGAMIDDPPGAPALTFDARLAGPGFDFNTVPLLLTAVELDEGLTLRFPHARISPPAYPTPEIAWATFVVEAREDVDAGPLGTVEAWRAVDPEHDMVFWLMDGPPHVVRVAFPVDESTRSVLELGAVRSAGTETDR